MSKLTDLALRLPFILTAVVLIGLHLVPLRAPDPPEEPVETVVEIQPEPVAEPAVVETMTRARPWTAQEEIMLARLIYEEARGVTGEKWGVSGEARQAAVIWTVLNRVDDGYWGDSIEEVVTYPAQFAYYPDTPVEVQLMNLVYDVLCRWEDEKAGGENVGRTLPPEYLYFGGEGGENYFRTDYDALGDNWDWSLPDPYKH